VAITSVTADFGTAAAVPGRPVNGKVTIVNSAAEQNSDEVFPTPEIGGGGGLLNEDGPPLDNDPMTPSAALLNGTGNAAPVGQGALAWGAGARATQREQTVYGKYNKTGDAPVQIGVGANDDNRETGLSMDETGQFKQFGGKVMVDNNGIQPVYMTINGEVVEVYLKS